MSTAVNASGSWGQVDTMSKSVADMTDTVMDDVNSVKPVVGDLLDTVRDSVKPVYGEQANRCSAEFRRRRSYVY